MAEAPRRRGARLPGTARLVAAYAAWRLTGARRAGRALVEALEAPDEARRTVAGMLLVKAGRPAVPLLREALRRRAGLPLALTVLGDVGDPAAAPDLQAFAGDADPRVARAAREALRTLAAGRPGTR
jgi:hypothetical protein